jgi:hypothetical protein
LDTADDVGVLVVTFQRAPAASTRSVSGPLPPRGKPAAARTSSGMLTYTEDAAVADASSA